MSAWNDANWIRPAMVSILNQTYSNFELLVVDDGSEDETFAAISSFEDPRIRVFRNTKRRYWLNAVNDLACDSKGDLIKLMCPDDILFPECLERGMALFRRHPEIGYIFCETDSIDERGTRLSGQDPRQLAELIDGDAADRHFLEHGCWLSTSSMFIPLEKWRQIGGLRDITQNNPLCIPNCEDFDLAARLQAKHSCGYLSEPLVGIRVHDGQVRQNWEARPLFIEAHLEITKAIAARQDDRAPSRRPRGYDWLLDRAAAYVNLGIGAIASGKVSDGLRIIQTVFRALPPTSVLPRYLSRTCRKIFRLSALASIRNAR